MLVVYGPVKASEAGRKHINDAALKINRKVNSTNHHSSSLVRLKEHLYRFVNFSSGLCLIL